MLCLFCKKSTSKNPFKCSSCAALIEKKNEIRSELICFHGLIYNHEMKLIQMKETMKELENKYKDTQLELYKLIHNDNDFP